MDTGSSSTILKLDIVEEIGLTVELDDVLGTISGVGGSEFVFFKTVDAIEVNGFKVEDFKVDIGTMDYGIDIDGIVGMDFLLKAKGIIDMSELILICK
ncbi:retropepsin-like aspartic protease [Cohnella terricola]|uniref:retropepsin-like aspartic protease n=1 Tax=Cohnella terricola TaxID=1289167 RepID=UPI00248285EC|nr:retropepsin-like aspartic protease [Cohnella terricola]